ncbi:MAG: putative quorum-sensing-regulated virulence factor [Burkholderiales bacterium]|jgi:uncharacterized protein (DUF3820 family)|nr:DUF3820 family protein [Burkholderiales bacterium]
MHPEDLEKLVIREMPFGACAGRLSADLPGSWLHWFVRNRFAAGEIGRFQTVDRCRADLHRGSRAAMRERLSVSRSACSTSTCSAARGAAPRR